MRVFTDGVAIGPILMGVNKPVHILTTSATSRRILNMTAIAAVDAQIRKQIEAERRRKPSFRCDLQKRALRAFRSAQRKRVESTVGRLPSYNHRKSRAIAR